jgi:HAD superfamily phosphoserine phosphatase-like hydrolase
MTIASAPRSVIWERIERVCVDSTRCAMAFDGDGTLWSGDVGEDFFHATVERNDFRGDAETGLRREAREHGLDDGGNADVVAHRIYDAYVAGKFPEERICELMAWAIAGWTLEEARAFSNAMLDARGFGARLHPEVVATLEWARARGIDVFVVSASPRCVIEAAAARLDVAPAFVIAATPVAERGVIHARAETPIPYGEGKVRHLDARLDGRTLVAAFGDNAFDVPMLNAARVPVAVRPKKRLLDRAAEVAGLLQIEPE